MSVTLVVPLPRKEWKAYQKQHRQLWHHNPRPAADGSTLCTHPVHRGVQTLMEAPGVDLDFPENPLSIDWDAVPSEER